MDEAFDDTDRSRRGTWVIARGFGGKAVRLRVWAEDEHAVWMLDDTSYRRRSDELPAPEPIGFQRTAVFVDLDDPDRFDPTPPPEFWQQLTPFEWRRDA